MRACASTSVALALLVLYLPAQGQDGQALRARHAALRAQLADNPFGRPLHVESGARHGDHKGAIYAVVEQPFARVGAALRRPAQWCEVLMLQANVKHCEVSNGAAETLSFLVARKPGHSHERAHRVELAYTVPAAGADYLHVALS